MKKISVVIITFNEAENIGRCMDSIQQVADDILVVDSFSSDATVDIAREKGARILQNPWEDYHTQRGFAVQHALFDHVLALDADEFLSEALVEAIMKVKGDWRHAGYRIHRLNKIGDTWIRHTSLYPNPTLRLFDRRMVTFETLRGHDLVVVAPGGSTGYIRSPLMHNYHDNLHDRGHRLNQQSTEAARYYFERKKKGSWIRIVLKPLGRFMVEFILRRGFLGGFYGLAISATAAHYVFLREIKLMEMHRLGKSYAMTKKKHELVGSA